MQFEQLEKLNDLNFDCIIEVKSSELFTLNGKENGRLNLENGNLRMKSATSEFIDILESLSPSRIQFLCEYFGLWWKEKK